MNRVLIFLLYIATVTGCGGSGGGSNSDGDTSKIQQYNLQEGVYVNVLPNVVATIELVNNLPESKARLVEIDMDFSADGAGDKAGDDLSIQAFLEDDIDQHYSTSHDLKTIYWRDDGGIGGTDLRDLGISISNVSGKTLLEISYRGVFNRQIRESFQNGTLLYRIEARSYSSLSKDSLVSFDEYPDGGVYTNMLGMQLDESADYQGSESSADINTIELSHRY